MFNLNYMFQLFTALCATKTAEGKESCFILIAICMYIHSGLWITLHVIKINMKFEKAWVCFFTEKLYNVFMSGVASLLGTSRKWFCWPQQLWGTKCYSVPTL